MLTSRDKAALSEVFQPQRNASLSLNCISLDHARDVVKALNKQFEIGINLDISYGPIDGFKENTFTVHVSSNLEELSKISTFIRNLQ